MQHTTYGNSKPSKCKTILEERKNESKQGNNREHAEAKKHTNRTDSIYPRLYLDSI